MTGLPALCDVTLKNLGKGMFSRTQAESLNELLRSSPVQKADTMDRVEFEDHEAAMSMSRTIATSTITSLTYACRKRFGLDVPTILMGNRLCCLNLFSMDCQMFDKATAFAAALLVASNLTELQLFEFKVNDH
jgi:hypothetical protein